MTTLDTALCETFRRPGLDPRLQWHAPPARWAVEPARACLRVEPDAGTDFWQRTHYGFEADNGHFLGLRARGDFRLTTRVTAFGMHQYDQAGLMVRVSPGCWLKTSAEFELHGPQQLGAVVTNGRFSDWSTQPLARDVTTVWFRVRRRGADYLVEHSLDGVAWQQLRVAHLHEAPAESGVACGLYACSPKGAGFRAEFAFLEFEPLPG